MRAVPSAVIAMLFLAGCHRGHERPLVRDAWVRLPAVPGLPGAAYLTIEGGARPAGVVAVASPAGGSSEIHESMGGGGTMATMRPVAAIAVPPQGVVTLRPGGLHVMLFGLDPALARGRTIPLRVRFADGATIAVPARVVAAGDAAPY